MEEIYDENVKNTVYYETAFPRIRYLKDGEVYYFGEYKTLVIGGAYSVDKWHRLSKAKPNDNWTGWFKDEQLTAEEMSHIEEKYKNQTFDFVLTHTCPFSWQPTDLFLNTIDSSSVDYEMEFWLEKIKKSINWDIWLFGHYHDDRFVRPKVEMFFTDINNLDDIYFRWHMENLEPFGFKDPNYNEEI